jgi:hypothetical protein
MVVASGMKRNNRRSGSHFIAKIRAAAAKANGFVEAPIS